MPLQQKFEQWNGRTGTFNPTYASKELPNYVKKENAYGDYDTSKNKQKDYVNQISDGSNWNSNLQNIAKQVETGKQSQDAQNAYKNTNQTINNLSNTLKTQPQQRNIQEGYTSEELNKMAENGVGQLKDAYNTALNKAAASYNRLGLRGSGFEIADEFGNQSDSITSNYLKNVQQLQNDIDVKGLEAAREDRYKNADANDLNRQKYLENLEALAKTQQGFGDSLNKNDLDWDKNKQDVEFKNKDSITSAVKLNQDISNQSDAQQRGWAQLNGGLAQNDENAVMDRWKSGYDVDKTTIGNQQQLYNTLLQTLGIAATGDQNNYNNFITQLNQSPDWLKQLLGSVGFTFNS